MKPRWVRRLSPARKMLVGIIATCMVASLALVYFSDTIIELPEFDGTYVEVFREEHRWKLESPHLMSADKQTALALITNPNTGYRDRLVRAHRDKFLFSQADLQMLTSLQRELLLLRGNASSELRSSNQTDGMKTVLGHRWRIVEPRGRIDDAHFWPYQTLKAVDLIVSYVVGQADAASLKVFAKTLPCDFPEEAHIIFSGFSRTDPRVTRDDTLALVRIMALRPDFEAPPTDVRPRRYPLLTDFSDSTELAKARLEIRQAVLVEVANQDYYSGAMAAAADALGRRDDELFPFTKLSLLIENHRFSFVGLKQSEKVSRALAIVERLKESNHPDGYQAPALNSKDSILLALELDRWTVRHRRTVARMRKQELKHAQALTATLPNETRCEERRRTSPKFSGIRLTPTTLGSRCR